MPASSHETTRRGRLAFAGEADSDEILARDVGGELAARNSRFKVD